MSDFNNLKCVILIPDYVLLTLGMLRKKSLCSVPILRDSD